MLSKEDCKLVCVQFYGSKFHHLLMRASRCSKWRSKKRKNRTCQQLGFTQLFRDTHVPKSG